MAELCLRTRMDSGCKEGGDDVLVCSWLGVHDWRLFCDSFCLEICDFAKIIIFLIRSNDLEIVNLIFNSP